jgi:hypothetical protein
MRRRIGDKIGGYTADHASIMHRRIRTRMTCGAVARTVSESTARTILTITRKSGRREDIERKVGCSTLGSKSIGSAVVRLVVEGICRVRE